MKIWSTACTAIGSVLLLLGILAGLVNRNVLDGDRFAQHVDSIRRDPAVSRQIGQAISNRAVAADPQLLAVRPLVEAASTSLAASPTFSPVVRAAAAALHRTITGQDSGDITLRLLDVGVAIVGILPAIAPGAAAYLPGDLQVTLARVSGRGLAADVVHLSRLVGVLSWLLPLLAAVFLVAGVWAAPDRHRAGVRTGWGIAASGAAIGLLAFTGSLYASTADEQTLHGALVAASWREFGGLLWWAAGLTLLAGVVIVAAVTAWLPEGDLGAWASRAWSVVVHRPARRPGRIVHGAVLLVVGTGAILRPALTFGVLAALVGIALVVAGLGEIASAAGARRLPRAARPGRRRRWVPAVALGAAVALVVATVAVGAVPVSQRVAVAAESSVGPASAACNGHVELCSRRYNDVAFPATHNAMSAADESGWFIPEQPTGVIGQLDAGIRVLLIDSYYGQTTQQTGLVATAPQSYAAALADAEASYGPDVVASALRLRNAITSRPTGPVTPYLCHGLCELGATQWEPLMMEVRAWLQAHPRQVVTFFIEDSVSPADTAAIFSRTGLLPYVYTPTPGGQWPTLGQMIDSGHRLVVLMERHGGGSADPWLLQGFHWVQDTPFSNPTVASLTCRLNRGAAASPLFLVNYWLTGFRSLLSNAQKINAYDVMWPYVSRCEQERRRVPNFVAVNFYNEGDLFRVIDRLNGVG